MADTSAIDDTPTPEEAILRLRGVGKTYGTGELAVHALRDVDIEFHRAELLVLLGASGSGKSTLLNIVGGLDRPSRGSVLLDGVDLATADDGTLTRYRRDSVGFVFQFYNLVPGLTAAENVNLVTEIASDPMPTLEALALVDMEARAHHFPAQLSGGEQQRIAIARAIAKKPRILLCDEPTGALDSKTGVLVLEAIDRANRELGTTTALITHNVATADMAHRVVTISDGRIVDVRRNEQRRRPGEIRW